MVRRDILIDNIKSELFTFITNKKGKAELVNFCYTKYNLPQSIVLDVLDRADMEGKSDFELFIIASAFDQVLKGDSRVQQFFTENDIKTFSNMKYETDTIKYPIRIKCWKVNEDQYIGIIDVFQLMAFRKAQLITYNTNTQRVMKRVISGSEERYEISVNTKAVKQIQESLRDKYYISNTITLNIPDSVDADYIYDEEKGELIIYSIEHFDILDGYHRYLALSHENDLDNTFNYPMEIRITTFDEIKARQFIFQEDQKTKMRKVDSDSMNMNNISNQIVNKLNDNKRFDLNGKISRNQGLINFSDLTTVIDQVYLKGNKHKYERNEIINITKEISDKFNDFIYMYPEFAEHKYSYNELLVLIYAFSIYDEMTDENALRVKGVINAVNDKKQPYKELIKLIDKELNNV